MAVINWQNPFCHMIAVIAFFSFGSGSHLSSHTVASIVLSAAHVLTVVFGMGTGVTHDRIDTGQIILFFNVLYSFLFLPLKSKTD